MTATLPPPAAPTTSPPPDRAEGRPLRRRPPGHLVLAEAALFLLTAAAVAGFSRIFSDWSFLAPLLVIAAVGHAVAAGARRRGFGLPVSAVASALGWVLAVTWLFFVETTTALLPTPDTWTAARLELDRSWETFHEVVAPAPVQTGFLLAAAAAVGAGAYLADWAAFRLWSAREAIVPAATLFVFATVLADERHRVLSAALVTSAALLFLLVHRVVRLERSEAWVGAGAQGAARRLLVAGVVVGLAAVLLGAAVAPLLPGADADAIVDVRGNRSGDNARLLTSPLVDIRSRLVDTSNTPLFTVRSEVPAYWRIAGLDGFDGTQWGLSATTDQVVDGPLDLAGEVAAPFDEVRHSFAFDNLETKWLPAAYRAAVVDPQVAPLVRFDAETDTLIADDSTAQGTAYDVVSRVPVLTPALLRTAGPGHPAWTDRALELPDDFSETARRLAEEQTAGATTAYDKAMALQSFFRDEGGFTYDTTVDIGQDNDAIEEFLDVRRGYCEQFAGTYAAMARSVGLPARVAVGYTWGEADPADPSLYQVVGRNAHAWPEVWLGQFGWVAFEPTPGRGNPDAESYTGVAADQTDEDVTAPTTTVAPEAESTTTTAAPALPPEQAAATPSGPTGVTDDPLRSAALVLAVLVAVAAAYLLAVPGTLALRRRRRRARAGGSASARTALAWTETTEVLAAGGVRARSDETHTELAGRAGATWPAAAGPLDRLAGAADAAAFGPDPDGDVASTTEADAQAVRRTVDDSLGALGRVVRFLDPRPLWAGRIRRHRIG